MRQWIVLLLSLGAAPAAQAAVEVFACEPEWAALARELGGEQVEVFSATTARQDPHRVQARPALIARARGADLLVCTGADLEEGWLPLLLRRSRNPDIQPGRPGHLLAADQVTLKDVPGSLDRAGGHVHPRGNPHVHTDPRNIARVAEALGARLMEIDPAHAQHYRARLESFRERWGGAVDAWERRAGPLAGRRVLVHHREWIYLLDWLGMERVGSLEPKPGLPPGPGHLAELQRLQAQRPADLLIRSATDDRRAADWLAERTGIRVVTLPYTVGADEAAGDLFGLFDAILVRLLEAVP
jgi:zinc/manganese transport system substrate-binding protein